MLEKPEFEILFRQHYQALCHFAFGLVADMDQAEDLVQQVFIGVWEKRAQMDPARSLKSYLYTSVRNRAINHIRNTRKFSSQILDSDIYGPGDPGLPATVTGDLIAMELTEKIGKVLAEMPQKSLEVFQLSRFEGMKYKEISEKLGVTVKTVEAHMSRALKILRDELKDYLLLFILYFLR